MRHLVVSLYYCCDQEVNHEEVCGNDHDCKYDEQYESELIGDFLDVISRPLPPQPPQLLKGLLVEEVKGLKDRPYAIVMLWGYIIDYLVGVGKGHFGREYD